jgi:hypothetical protein
MNRLFFSLLVISLSSFSVSKTSLYGEANGFTQFRSDSSGSALQVYGYLSQFGFKSEAAVSETLQATFDVTMGFELLDSWGVYTKQGTLGITGEYGELAMFYGQSPLAKTNQFLSLMENDPDQISGVFYANRADDFNVKVGFERVDGLLYSAPILAEHVAIDFAIVPAELVGGESGFSFATTYDNSTLKAAIAFEVNVEAADTQLLRVIGDTKVGSMRVGLGLQAGSNSALDSSARTYLGYLKMPLNIGTLNTRMKALMSLNQVTDAADNTDTQVYASVVDEVPLNDKVSTYGFVEVQVENDLNNVTSFVGLGLKMNF